MVIVIPAEGPSFGTAASGTCMWISFFEKSILFKPKISWLDFIQETEVDMDSFIISPIFPVKIVDPFPLNILDSIRVRVPPFKVYANP